MRSLNYDDDHDDHDDDTTHYTCYRFISLIIFMFQDPDHIINLILSLVYYFLNLSPISHGSSAVAWSVAVGLIMSVGRDVTGRIGPGKV